MPVGNWRAEEERENILGTALTLTENRHQYTNSGTDNWRLPPHTHNLLLHLTGMGKSAWQDTLGHNQEVGGEQMSTCRNICG